MVPKEKINYISEHFSYEVSEMMYAGQFWLSLITHKKEFKNTFTYDVFRNMIIDHLLLHARNLLEFFYYKGDEDKYAKPDFYARSWETPEKTPQISILEKRVNSEITHLGLSRLDVTVEEKPWELAKLVNELLQISEQFLDKLEPEYYNELLKILRSEIKKCYIKIDMIEGRPAYIFNYDFLGKLVDDVAQT